VPEVGRVDDDLKKNINEVTEMLLKSSETAAGLAATQVGFKQRFFGLKVDKKKQVEIFINPQIVQTFGQKVYPMIVFDNGKQENFLEGCLSFPNLFGTVKRYLKIEIKWDEIKNSKLINKKKLLEGFEAIVFQHEQEHLDGIVFVDHIKEDKGDLYLFEGEKKKAVDVNEVI